MALKKWFLIKHAFLFPPWFLIYEYVSFRFLIKRPLRGFFATRQGEFRELWSADYGPGGGAFPEASAGEIRWGGGGGWGGLGVLGGRGFWGGLGGFWGVGLHSWMFNLCFLSRLYAFKPTEPATPVISLSITYLPGPDVG